MASVFLSYDRDDASVARRIALALENAGHSVWWDKQISGGTQFAKEIEQALNNADVVVVLWTSYSMESPWVRDEAGSGRDRGRLVPLSLDGTLPPLGFRQFQSIDLGAWRGRGKVPRLPEILAAVERQAEEPGIPVTTGSTPVNRRRSGPSVNMWAIVAVSIGMFFVIVGLLIGRPWERTSSSTPTVSVRAADPSALSQNIARDLVLKLGELQFARAEPIRLVAQGEDKRADLFLEAGAPAVGRANLLLKDGRDGAILWSAEFERPQHQAADLSQQLAFTSARVLACGAEGRSAGERLKPEALKSYLNACAQLADLSVTDPAGPLRALNEIVREEPRFKPAWVKLLMAENELVRASMVQMQPDSQAISALRKHIAQARKLDPNMAVAAVAEATLFETTDIPRHVSMLEEAAARFPDDPYVQSFYAGALGKIGRLRDSVDAAERGVELDPLSPSQRDQYISALAYSGAFGPAKRELQKAEQLWPGTASVRDAEFRFHYRYGDPKIARAIFEEETSGGGQAVRLYLDAREDPSPAKVEPLLAYVRERLTKMEHPSAGLSTAIQTYAQFAGKEETFGLLLGWPKRSDLAFMADILFRPHLREVRRDVRFMRVAQRLGLITYWQQSGRWPDYCFEPGLPYDCKKEAAKLKPDRPKSV